MLLNSGDQTEVKYVVKVQGTVRSAPLPRHLAETFVGSLPVEEQGIAQIVPTTSGGQEILLG